MSSRLEALLNGLGCVRSIRVVSTSDDALRHTEIMKPDLVLTNANLPEGQGLQVLARLKESFPSVRRYVLGFDLSERFRRSWMAAGAEDVFDVSTQIDELLYAVRMSAQ